MKILVLTNERHASLLERELDQHAYIDYGYNTRNLGTYDAVISYCYKSIIKPEELSTAKNGIINIHPAPLPAYRGMAVYNFGILNEEKKWGYSMHYMDQGTDTGDIISVNYFDIDPDTVTAYSLRKFTHDHMVNGLRWLIGALHVRRKLPAMPQGAGTHYSKGMMERYRRIELDDKPEVVDRKIRAFWCPPHQGAYIQLGDNRYTLVTDKVLQELDDV